MKNEAMLSPFEKLLQTTLLLVIVSLLSGCGGGSSGEKPTEKVVSDDVSKYSEASCLYAFNFGPSIESRESSRIESPHFGKAYDAAILNPTLAASGEQVVRFSEMTGVRFFNVNFHEASNCSYGAALPEAPSDLQKEFSSINEKGLILGLYLPKGHPKTTSTANTAAILVRQDTNKWVLVHELMHHLFQVELDKTPLGAIDLKIELTKAFEAYEVARARFDRNPNETTSNEAAEKLIRLNSLVIEFLKQYFLEEMTIETIMGKKLEEGSLRLVHRSQRINGAAYVVVSEKKAKEFMDLILPQSQRFEMFFGSLLKPELRLGLRNELRRYDKIKSEMAELSHKARLFLLSEGVTFKGLELATKSEDTEFLAGVSHVGCAHSHEAEQVMKRALQTVRARRR